MIYAVGHVLQITSKLPTGFSYVIESDEMKNLIKAVLNSGKVRQKFSFHFYTTTRHAGNEKGEWKRWLEHWRENTKEKCNSVIFFLWSIKYTSTWAEGVWCLIRVIIWGWLWHQTEMCIRNNDSCVQWPKREPLWRGN